MANTPESEPNKLSRRDFLARSKDVLKAVGLISVAGGIPLLTESCSEDEKAALGKKIGSETQAFIDKALSLQLPGNHVFLYSHDSPGGESYESYRIKFFENSDPNLRGTLIFYPFKTTRIEVYNWETSKERLESIGLDDSGKPIWIYPDNLKGKEVTEKDWSGFRWHVDGAFEKALELYQTNETNSRPFSDEEILAEQHFIGEYDNLLERAWETQFTRRETWHSGLVIGTVYFITEVRKDFGNILEMQNFYLGGTPRITGNFSPPHSRFIWIEDGDLRGKITITNGSGNIRWYEYSQNQQSQAGRRLTIEEMKQVSNAMNRVYERAKLKDSL